VASLLDGKTFAEDEIVVAVGVTTTGKKVLLQFTQTGAENRKACATFLPELVERGLGLVPRDRSSQGLALPRVREVSAQPQPARGHKREMCSSICRAQLSDGSAEALGGVWGTD